jgi:hypothetical protein
MVPMSTPTSPSDESRAAARALIEERATLEAWLAKLEERAGSVPAHVANRVRADYLDRLRRVTGALGAHLDTVREDYDAVRARLADVSARHAAAVDRMEELRLRHLIGEVTDQEWDAQSSELERAVRATEEERSELQGEMEHVEELLSEVEEANQDAGSPREPRTREDRRDLQPERAAAPEPWSEPLVGLVETPGSEESDLQMVEGEELTDMILDDLVASDPVGEEMGVDAVPGLEVQSEVGSHDDPEPEPTVVEGLTTGREEWDADEDWEPSLETVEEPPAAEAEAEALPWLDAVVPDKPAASTEEPFDDLDFLRTITDQEVGSPQSGSEPVDRAAIDTAADDDLAFLADLDRVISESTSDKPAGKGKKAVACKDCGSPNDSRSWYCEVCGSELG